MNYYQDKVIWITGASSGIGEYLVYELSRFGASIILSSRRPEELHRVAKSSGLSENNYKILPLDLANHSSIPDVVEQAMAWKGRIDILINNGGVSQRALAQNTTLDVEKKLFNINYFGTIEVTRHVIPHMIKNGGGHINVVSSVLGKIGVSGRSSYCGSKHALHGYLDVLRSEVYEHGVHISVVCPGYIKTNVSKNALSADGNPHDKMDHSQMKGMSAEKFAKKMVRKLRTKRNEYYIGGPEVFAVYLMRWVPWLVYRVQRRIKFK